VRLDGLVLRRRRRGGGDGGAGRLGPRRVPLDGRRREEAERVICGGALDVELLGVDISNNATYTHFVVTTPGGSVFRVESREGGVVDSEVEANAREDPAAFLRALMELGDECSGTYCRATLPTRGADLTIGTDGFEILEPSKGSTKEGTFTCSAE
jgi:hypothetical protein